LGSIAIATLALRSILVGGDVPFLVATIVPGLVGGAYVAWLAARGNRILRADVSAERRRAARTVILYGVALVVVWLVALSFVEPEPTRQAHGEAAPPRAMEW
jgi:hypothetical protein